jgi:2-oxoglutarate ferredoxin oxidoreductase subunit alpha
MAAHAEQLGICVRQVEDEIAVLNLAIGANHVGVRAMCATSGGGFSLMTEALGMSGMIETPVVVINAMRAGPSTGVPTKTEQGDLTQALGASHGDYPRVIVAPTSIEDALRTIPEVWNIADRFQLPAIVLSDMLIADSGITLDPAVLDLEPEIDRGELILDGNGAEDSAASYLRYKNTESGISPRAVPGVPGHLFVAATDEHDEDGVVISDVYTDPVRRKRMVDKRSRKWLGILAELPAPELAGPKEADVTFVGWGSTQGVITEAICRLAGEGITANHLQVKWMQPLHCEAIAEVFKAAKKTIMVENNHTGQFARYLRSETGLVVDGHIRKYDGEPFETQHIVAGTKAILGGEEVYEALSTEPGLQTEHPAVVMSGTPRTR